MQRPTSEGRRHQPPTPKPCPILLPSSHAGKRPWVPSATVVMRLVSSPVRYAAFGRSLLSQAALLGAGMRKGRSRTSQRLHSCRLRRSKAGAIPAYSNVRNSCEGGDACGLGPIPTRRGVKEGYICPEQSLLFFCAAAAFAWGRPCGRVATGAFLGGEQSVMTPLHTTAGWFRRGAPAGAQHLLYVGPAAATAYCGSERPLARTPNGDIRGLPISPPAPSTPPTHPQAPSPSSVPSERSGRVCRPGQGLPKGKQQRGSGSVRGRGDRALSRTGTSFIN